MPAEWLHVQDELYFHLRGPAQNVTVLATAYFDPGQRGSGRHEPVIFTVEFGKGRIFHTALGHADYSMRCVGFITSLARGTEWAATGRVTLPIPNDFPTAERTRGHGDTAVSSMVRPPLPAWPALPVPPPPAKNPHNAAGRQAPRRQCQRHARVPNRARPWSAILKISRSRSHAGVTRS